MFSFRKIFLSLLLLFVFSFGKSQPLAPAKLDWGNEYSEPSGTAATKIIGLTSDGFYLLRQKVLNNPNAKPKAWIEFYDYDMNLKKSEEQDLKYKGKQRDFEDMVFLGGELYLLTSFNNSAKKKNYLFRQKVSTKSLLPAKNLDMICETDARNKEVEGSFGIHTAKDSSHLLIYNDLPYQKNQPERFGFRVFDRAFELVWAKDIVLPYPDNQFTVEEYQVDALGNVHLLGVLYTDSAKWRRRGSPNYQYVILSYFENGEKMEEFRVAPDNKFITDLTFRPMKNGDLICAGFYSEKNTYSVKGAYYFRLDPRTRELTNVNSQPFPFEFLTEYMSDRNKDKAKAAEDRNDAKRAPELYNYSLDELITRSDGGAVLVAEQFYIVEDRFNNDPFFNPYGFYPYSPFAFNRYRNPQQVDYYYNYNDIIVVNIRPNGEIEWASRIPKRQETRNDGGYYSSYAMSIVRDKLFFVYNDNARNFNDDRKSDRIYNFNGNDSVISLSQISITGEVTTYPLASNRDAGILTRPKMCKQIGKKEMALYGERGRGYRFGKLVFD